MTDVNIITVSQFGDFAPEVDTTRYAAPTVSGMIAQASKSISDYLGYSPYAEDIVSELKESYVTTEGDLLIMPQKVPVQSVSRIALKKGTISVNLTLTDGVNTKYNIDYTKRTIRYPSAELAYTGTVFFANLYSLRSRQFYVEMDYRGGFEADQLPASIQLACVLLTKDLLAGQYNITGARSITQGGISMSFSMMDSRLSKQVKNLLNPYRRI